MFAINQIVKAKTSAHFVILGFRTIGGEEMAQLKEVCQVTGKARRGEIALPVSILKAI